MDVTESLPLTALVQEIVTILPDGIDGLASRLSVSSLSVQRWLAGSVSPRPEVEGQIRAIAEHVLKPAAIPLQNGLFEEVHLTERLRNALLQTCREIRESLHRRSRLSNRHEALDELAKLLFAHVMSVSHDGPGIESIRSRGRLSLASNLRLYVADAYKKYLPKTLAHELKANDFDLQIKDSESELAQDIIDSFRPLQDNDLVKILHGRNNVDILNEAFGQFLTDSFADEKQLGQYLTPVEVVKFMVSLGLQGLSSEDRAELLDLSGKGLILDPSCGVGSFLTEVLRVLYAAKKTSEDQESADQWLEATISSRVVGIDKSERMLRLALTNFAMFGVQQINLHLANALSKSGADGNITSQFDGKAVLILTNPPFGANFPVREVSDYKLIRQWCSKRPLSVDSELLFMERYLDWLRPGGQLLSIVPDSVLTNRGLYRELRSGIFSLAEITAIISLPPTTFGMAGTSTKTSVLQLRKKSKGATANQTFFACCHDLGYEVQTRGSTRSRIQKGVNELPSILIAARSSIKGVGRMGQISQSDERWDATYHAGLSDSFQTKLVKENGKSSKVQDFAELRSERINPVRRGSNQLFDYIEISDVDASTCVVRSKRIRCDEAPSRARKLVKAGDVLVSTVRPERKTAGVVPAYLDGAVCSTGFAVLKCKTIDPLVMARLLQTDFVTAQLMRDNSGIAYPAFEEQRLLDVVLPIFTEDLRFLAQLAVSEWTVRLSILDLEREFASALTTATQSWLTS